MVTKITKEIKKLIENNPVAFASKDKKGNIHCIAVAFVKVVSENQVLITDNYMKKTKENILENSQVALAVWNNKNWQKECIGYELKGIAKYYSKGKWYKRVKEIPENKKEPCKGAVLVTIQEIKKLA